MNSNVDTVRWQNDSKAWCDEVVWIGLNLHWSDLVNALDRFEYHKCSSIIYMAHQSPFSRVFHGFHLTWFTNK